VSWHLGAADLGNAAQQDDFRADADLPSGWYQVKAADYVDSGFDRGHNCPSADRTATAADN
jgi:endonuclease G